MKPYILIIEDDLMIQEVFKVKLSKSNLNLELLYNGQDAIDFIDYNAKNTPSIIVIDIILPAVSGFEIIEKIKKTTTWKNIPIIIISNIGQNGDFEKAKNFGVDDYFIKSETKIDCIVEKIFSYIDQLA